jgi:hypothetical protein
VAKKLTFSYDFVRLLSEQNICLMKLYTNVLKVYNEQITVSVLKVYNEQIHDLLLTGSQPRAITKGYHSTRELYLLY